MWSPRPRALVVLLLALAGCGGAKQAASTGSGTPTAQAPATGDLGVCAGKVQDDGRNCYTREIQAIVAKAGDKPLPAVQQVTEAAYQEKSGFLLANCHGIMHTVGREWAVSYHLTLARLMDYVPRTNDPGCSAGFGHGLVTGVAPEIQQKGAKAAAAEACGKAKTRYEDYSCIHGF